MRRVITACAVGLVVLGNAAARADEVTEWNQMLLRTSLVASLSPLHMTRFAAIVQAAVFDAINGIDGRYTPVHVPPAAPHGASRRAAAVQAAYAILTKMYGLGGLFTPNQQSTLDARRAASLAEIAEDESAGSIASGIAWGQTVADAIWTWRSTDGFSLAPPTYTGSTLLGQWRPTPNAPYPGTSTNGIGYPSYSTMVPWAIASPSQFRPGGPPALTSARYARDFNETKAFGSQTSAIRSDDQTVAAWFWQVTSAVYFWDSTALALIARRHHGDDHDREGGNDRDDDWARHRHAGLLQNARLLATLNIAMADATIGCFDAKYTYTFWRPITAIRETADDGNPATSPDTGWTPLFATPAHPEYPSAHGCISGAGTAVLAHEFGEHVRFTVTNDQLVGVTRTFHSFADAIEEVGNARIWAGIHFRSATDDGTALGVAVARYVLDHALQQLH